MYPVRDSIYSGDRPIVTYALIVLNLVLFLWDRNWSPLGPSLVFTDLSMTPRDVLLAIRGNGDPKALATLFTSMFLHGNLVHLLGNLIFLLTFGPNVEAAFGGPRFALYYLFWGFCAVAAQIFVVAYSTVPMLGASGAIGGVLGAYFLLFPASRISMLIMPIFFMTFEIAAWVLLGLWFIWQIAFPQQGVANWAHAGGFLAGMLTVLIGGGRQRLLNGQKFFSRDGDAVA